jgi:hypothetical protein
LTGSLAADEDSNELASGLGCSVEFPRAGGVVDGLDGAGAGREERPELEETLDRGKGGGIDLPARTEDIAGVASTGGGESSTDAGERSTGIGAEPAGAGSASTGGAAASAGADALEVRAAPVSVAS